MNRPIPYSGDFHSAFNIYHSTFGRRPGRCSVRLRRLCSVRKREKNGRQVGTLLEMLLVMQTIYFLRHFIVVNYQSIVILFPFYVADIIAFHTKTPAKALLCQFTQNTEPRSTWPLK